MDKKQVHLRFTVQVAGDRYTYSGASGSAEVAAEVPRHFVPMLDLGNVFEGVLQSALEQFDAKLAAEDEE